MQRARSVELTVRRAVGEERDKQRNVIDVVDVWTDVSDALRQTSLQGKHTKTTDLLGFTVVQLQYVDSIDEENSSVFSLIRMCWLPSQGHAGSKTLHQQNPPVLNWRCR